MIVSLHPEGANRNRQKEVRLTDATDHKSRIEPSLPFDHNDQVQDSAVSEKSSGDNRQYLTRFIVVEIYFCHNVEVCAVVLKVRV